MRGKNDGRCEGCAVKTMDCLRITPGGASHKMVMDGIYIAKLPICTKNPNDGGQISLPAVALCLKGKSSSPTGENHGIQD